MSIHEFKVTDIDGNERSLADYRGKVLLVVNVASECGLTPHYAGLQKLYEQNRDRGLEVLGFPCNQFGAQEPGTEADIKAFCSTRFSVTFPMFAKVDVNGDNRAPLFAWLTAQTVGPDAAGDVKWNFAKFVVDKKGEVIARFAPPTAPDDAALVAAIDRALVAS